MVRTRAITPNDPRTVPSPNYLVSDAGRPFASCAEFSQFSQNIVPNPTKRSAEIVQRLPADVILEILRPLITWSLLRVAVKTPFYHCVLKQDFFQAIDPLRRVCRSWNDIIRIHCLGGGSLRGGVFILLRLDDLAAMEELTLRIKSCVLYLGRPNNLSNVQYIISFLRRRCGDNSAMLDAVTAIAWDENNRFTPCNRGQTLSLALRRSRNYGRHFEGLCVQSVDLEDFWEKVYGGARGSFPITDRLVSDMLTILHYHAHILRQIFGYFRQLRYLDMPAFMLPPLFWSAPPEAPGSPELPGMLEPGYDQTGTPISDTFSRISYLQVLIFPDPTLKWDGIEPHPFECEKHILKKVHCRWPNNMADHLRGIGLQGLPRPRWSTEEFSLWLPLVKSFVTPNLENVHLSNPHCKQNDPFIGPLNFTISEASRCYTKHLGRYSGEHLCKLLSSGALKDIPDVKLSLPSICADLFQVLARNSTRRGGRVHITADPRVCTEYLEQNPQPGTNDLESDVDILLKMVADARRLNSDVILDFKVRQGCSFPEQKIKTLRLLPSRHEVEYSRVALSSSEEPPILALGESEFFSRLTTLVPAWIGDGLFALLDNLLDDAAN